MNLRRYTAALVALFVLLGITAFWGVSQAQARRSAEMQIENKYNRAFYEVIQRSKNIEALLSKGLASGSHNNMDNLFSDLWYNANAAQENLHQLPLSHNVIAKTSKFLTQVGDYAYAITKRDDGTKMTDEDRSTMRELYKTAKALNRELTKVQQQAAAGKFRWSEVQKGISSNFAKGSMSADRSFRSVESQMQELPTLIYDGPFSDHLERAKPLGVTGKEVTAEQAQEKARSFIDFKGAKVREERATGTVKGKIPAYGFEFRTGDDDSPHVITANVSKTGGHVIYYTNSRQVDEAKISEAQARTFAENFLKSRGIKNMEPTYTLREGNTLTVSFAYKEGDVIVYPDLIKVLVALDNGQILTYDALGYLMSHHERDLPSPKISISEARKKLNPELEVEEERMAVIPSDGNHERLTYEFKAKMDGEDFLVYINALTGAEERIFKLLHTPGGTLVL
ncbi:MAG: germination protein YpeB [Thermacetogeniaceae bacterium]